MATADFTVQGGFHVGNITIEPSTGIVGANTGTPTTILSGNTKVDIPTANGNIVLTSGGNSIATVTNANIYLTGNIIPTTNNTFNLGTPTQMFHSVYVGPGSLYVNGQQVLSSNSGTIVVSADVNQNLSLQTSGSGSIVLNPTGTGTIQAEGTITLTHGYNITSSDGGHVAFSQPIEVDGIYGHTSGQNFIVQAASGGGYINFLSNAAFGNVSISGSFNPISMSLTGTTNSTGTGTGTLVVPGGASITKDLWVGGTVFTNNLTSISTTTLNVTSPLVYLTATPAYPYSYDIGLYSHFVGGTGNIYQHTGVVRNHVDGNWYFFSNAAEPGGGTIAFTDPNIALDSIKLNNISASGNISANGTVSASSVSASTLTITGATTLQQSQELISYNSGSTGTINFDMNQGGTFYANALGGNVTANFTNVATTAWRSTVAVVVIPQGASPHYPSSVQINGVAANVNWLNTNVPTPVARRTEVYGFTMLRTDQGWANVLATYANFG